MIEQGDALCEQASDDFAPLERDYASALKQGDYIKAGDIMDSISLITDKRTAGFEALETSDDDAEAVDAIVENSKETTNLMATMADSLREKDTERILSASTEMVSLSTDSQMVAKEFGFVKCGSGTVAPTS